MTDLFWHNFLSKILHLNGCVLNNNNFRVSFSENENWAAYLLDNFSSSRLRTLPISMEIIT